MEAREPRRPSRLDRGREAGGRPTLDARPRVRDGGDERGHRVARAHSTDTAGCIMRLGAGRNRPDLAS